MFGMQSRFFSLPSCDDFLFVFINDSEPERLTLPSKHFEGSTRNSKSQNVCKESPGFAVSQKHESEININIFQSRNERFDSLFC